MNYPVSIIERAFQIARSGQHLDTKSVLSQLKREDYEHGELLQFRGSLSAQIKKVCSEAPLEAHQR
jgi:hypothetical protein